MIEVAHLTKRYGAFTAVDDLSFTAKSGEVLGLLGPNGAGKTTTMRILTGFMPPSEGTATIAGYDVTRQSLEARRQVGYMPERVPLYPDMTVEAYVEFWARLRGVRRARAEAVRALERVDLASRRKSLVRKLSKGMRQRLGLAQALVHNPPVIILDEPTIGIDPEQVIEVREAVRSLGQDHTVMFSTHILTEAEQVCDRVIILNKGQIVAEGAPDTLRRKLRTGGSKFYVVLGGAAHKQALTLLQSVPGVVEVQPDGEGFSVRVQDGVDVRPHLAERVQMAGYIVLELRPLDTTLEDIFLDLVGSRKRG